jgi:hypothetical protein
METATSDIGKGDFIGTFNLSAIFLTIRLQNYSHCRYCGHWKIIDRVGGKLGF